MGAQIDVLMSCGELFDSRTGSVLEDQVLLLADGRIKEIVPLCQLALRLGVSGDIADDIVAIADRCQSQYVDLSSEFVMPGLIEGHAHIGMDPRTSMDHMFLRRGLGETTVCSIKNAQADLLAGFTTVRDEASFGYTDVEVRDLIERGEIWGPRLKVSGMALTSTGGHADVHYRPAMGEISFPEAHIAYVVDGNDEVRRAVRNVIKRGADSIKLMATGGVLSDDARIGAPDLSFEEMRTACELARAHGKPTSAHAHGSQGIKNAIMAGVTSIEHGSLIDEEGCGMLVEQGVYLIPTLVAHRSSVKRGERGELPDAYYKKALQVEECAARGLSQLHELGARVGFGTDAGTSGNAHGSQAEEFALMMQQGGFSAVEALQSATCVNASLLGMWGEIGSIDVGKRADIVAFEGNPIKDISVMTRCSFVMKDGIVYKRGGVPVKGRL